MLCRYGLLLRRHPYISLECSENECACYDQHCRRVRRDGVAHPSLQPALVSEHRTLPAEDSHSGAAEDHQLKARLRAPRRWSRAGWKSLGSGAIPWLMKLLKVEEHLS